ncbi:MAG: hypothetical protein FWF02_03710 [Micrococcales bacterium]|nr:hypothetical protein [Micrococcales bacterium]MCL2666796.1 hypothetical protein [Micrococcales bacterium]
MPWWGWLALWSALVAGTLFGAFRLLLSLWDKLMALMDELERFEALAARLEAIVDPPPSTWVHPLVATGADVSQWRAGIADRRAQRTVRREARHEVAYRRWTRWWG